MAREPADDEQADEELDGLRSAEREGGLRAAGLARRADLLGATGDGEAALRARESAIELYREDLAEHPEGVDALVGLGELLARDWRIDELAEAENCLLRAVRLAPDRLEAYPFLARAIASQAAFSTRAVEAAAAQ